VQRVDFEKGCKTLYPMLQQRDRSTASKLVINEMFMRSLLVTLDLVVQSRATPPLRTNSQGCCPNVLRVEQELHHSLIGPIKQSGVSLIGPIKRSCVSLIEHATSLGRL
jgi:hypothetical protein